MINNDQAGNEESCDFGNREKDLEIVVDQGEKRSGSGSFADIQI